MFKHDFDPFAQMLDDVAALRQLPVLSPSAKALFFRSVVQYPVEQVLKAIEAHLIDPAEGKFKTMIQPAHIVAQIEAASAKDGRPDADEAWSTAFLAQDEAETVVWTAETAQAMRAALPLLASGDKVGARMAFKAAYDRLLAKARAEHRPVQWLPSLGHDPLRREQALSTAARAGQLPAPQVAALLPPPEDSANALDDDAARANIERLMKMLARAITPYERRMQERRANNENELQRLAGLKDASKRLAGETPDALWPTADLDQRGTA